MTNETNPELGPLSRWDSKAKEIVLEKLRFGVSQRIAAELLLRRSELHVKPIQEMLFGDLSMALISYVLADEVKSVKVEWPADWWQHFKQRWFPRWAIRRWPVVMLKHELCAQHIYPQLDSRCPEHESRIRMFVRKGIDY